MKPGCVRDGYGFVAFMLVACQSNAPIEQRTEEAHPSAPRTIPSLPAASSTSQPIEIAAVPCPEGMVGIDDEMCPGLKHTCLEKREAWQCARFAQESTCEGDVLPLRYCIDRYEYPNQPGVAPTLMVSWFDAKQRCEAVDKRLCTEPEWSLACEGPQHLPFPYGYVRDAEACNIDRETRYMELARLFDPATQADELARIDQREPSGRRPRCVSGYGVYDMTGNVDEWVVNPSGRPYRSSLKGGNWEAHRNACRPATRGHQPAFVFYPLGFRCCRDPLDAR